MQKIKLNFSPIYRCPKKCKKVQKKFARLKYSLYLCPCKVREDLEIKQQIIKIIKKHHESN
nr:MAG TPA: hypothetical protein [Caudoviricetes sp.]